MRGEAISSLPHAPMPKSLSRRAPRVVVKTTSRGPFREVEVVAKFLGGHFSKAKGTSQPPPRVVEWTTICGPSREGALYFVHRDRLVFSCNRIEHFLCALQLKLSRNRDCQHCVALDIVRKGKIEVSD
uniref:Uncharacterized protein n=1 Tax=Solanum tuberosum TaxID=4113 RepID=M1DYQ4_SOLTU